MRKILMASCSVACMVFIDAPGWAQDGAPPVDEIIVTARKRAESIQDVPISVTALDSAAIERNNITKVDQIASITPNVQLQPVGVNPTNLAPYIRGIGNRAQEPSQDSPVVISIDGVYLSEIAGSLIDVFDVQQVEVLRGPQGTLQGRNSPGGAINITTRRPTGKFGARFEASFERFDYLRLKGAVEAPVIADILAVKLAGFVDEGGAYMKDITTGGKAGGVRTWGGRLGLLFTPIPELKAYLTADYYRDRSQQPAVRPVNQATADGPRQPVSLACTFFGYCTPYGPYENGSDFTDRNSSKNGGVALNADWDVGPATLTSVTGYRYVNEINNTDVDNLPSPILHAMRQVTVRSFSQELRLSSKGNGPLDYTVGAYYLRSRVSLIAPLIIFGSPSASAREQVTHSRALFGQATYHITPKWSLSGGVRQTWDTKHMVSQPSYPATSPAGIADVTAKFSKMTFEAGTEYKLARGKLAYFRFAQGYRSGGVNGDAPSVAAINVYEPETVNSYEVGFKTDWLDRRLTTNIALFHYDFTNIQIIAVDQVAGTPIQRVVNGKGFKATGGELETTFRPTPEFTVTGSLGYLHSRYDSQLANIGFGPDTNLADLRKEYAPKLTGYFAVDYTIPIGAGESGSLVMSGDVNYRSNFTTNPVDNPVGFQSQYALVNAAITYHTPDDRYSLSVYGRNLTDKYYITNGEATGGVGLFQAVGRPRIWGIRGTARF